MESYLSFCCKGTNKLFDVRDFSIKYGLQYIGFLVHTDTDEIAFDIGQIVKIKGEYYSTELSHRRISDELISTCLKCIPIKNLEDYADFDINQFVPMDECNIFIDIWNTSIADDGPIWSLAYKNSSIARAQCRISGENDLDILIDESPITKSDFMAMQMSMQATAKSA